MIDETTTWHDLFTQLSQDAIDAKRYRALRKVILEEGTVATMDLTIGYYGEPLMEHFDDAFDKAIG